MSKEYNEKIANHYFRYRPYLHKEILSRTIGNNESFDFALDIGCGIGQSTKPLVKYCKRVYGVDPSHSMIDRAEKVHSVKFFCGDERALDQFEGRPFDLVTFAGSLFYSKNETLRKELKRICQTGAVIVVYDFKVLVEELLRSIGLELTSLDSSNYDHSINISDWKEFEERTVKREQVYFGLSSEELAHFILSHSTWYNQLIAQYGEQDPFNHLSIYLRSQNMRFQLTVNIFYSRYKADFS